MSTQSPDVGVEGRTIAELYKNRVAATPGAPAYMTRRGGSWETRTWGAAYEISREVAAGLLSLGLQSEERVAIFAGTREEWTLCDLGLVMAGGVTVPLYPSNTPDQCLFILNDSETAVLFAENAKQLAKVQKLAIPSLRHTVVFDEAGVQEGGAVLSLKSLRERGRAHLKDHPDALEAAGAKQGPDTTATIIYTSGTTGNPKGVVVAHDAYTVGTRYGVMALPVRQADTQLMFLPLAHSMGKLLSIVAVRCGFCTAFAESIDKLVDNLGEVRPQWMAGVPRIYEKVYGSFLNKAKEGGPLKYKLVQWAIRVGTEVSRIKQKGPGNEPGALLAFKYSLADKLVFSKLRARFGGRLRWFVSGSAPLSREMAEFFHAAGMLILEGYGLTETNSLTSINSEGNYKFGTVGRVLHPDLKVKFAGDGEILTKGVTNLRGYYKNPAATAEAIDEEGWFHTGDIGEMDSDGYIKITDRKKDLIKTSGGKYVAPQMIEGQLKMDPLVSQAVVIGDNRKYVTALIAVNVDLAKKAISEGGQQPPADLAALCGHELVKKRLDERMALINQKLGSWEQVKYFRVLPRELSEADGEMTPTMKIKRKVVTEHFGDLIESMYRG